MDLRELDDLDLSLPALEELLSDPQLLDASCSGPGLDGFGLGVEPAAPACGCGDAGHSCGAAARPAAAESSTSVGSYVNLLDILRERPARAAAASPQPGPSSSASGAAPAAPSSSSGSEPGAAGEASNRAPSAGAACRQEDGETRSGGSATSPVARPAAATAESEEEQRRQVRMARNRESAHASRQRKRTQFAELQGQNACLSAMVGHLQQENAALRHSLTAICQRTGQPLPPLLLPQPPMPQPAGFPAQPAGFAAQPAAFPAPFGAPFVPGMPVSQVPVQRLQPAAAPAAAAAAAAPAAKKRKISAAAAKGGATTLAALCCLLLFAGPSLPGLKPAGLPGTLQQGQGGQLLQLPGGGEPLSARGRVLQAVAGNDSLAALEQLQANSSAPAAAAEVLLYPLDTETERQSLQHLRDLAPAALLSPSGGGSLQPATLAALADSVFLPRGLASMDACEQVFSVAASPQQPQQQQPQAGSAGGSKAGAGPVAGRRAFGRALPLPPVGGSFPAIDQEEGAGSSSSCKDEDYVISVLLPTKDQGSGGRTGLDRLFVVVQKPDRFTTFSCPLRKTILA